MAVNGAAANGNGHGALDRASLLDEANQITSVAELIARITDEVATGSDAQVQSLDSALGGEHAHLGPPEPRPDRARDARDEQQTEREHEGDGVRAERGQLRGQDLRQRGREDRPAREALAQWRARENVETIRGIRDIA